MKKLHFLATDFEKSRKEKISPNLSNMYFDSERL